MKNESLGFTPSSSTFSQYWQLDPAVTFLNHGSFGACPSPVLELQQQLRQRIEHQPLQFFGRDLETLLDQARCQLAKFVGADPEDLAFVPNATTGVNTILRSLRFTPGDELLTTTQEYNACRNALNFVAERTGAIVVVADVPYPIASPDQVVAAVLSATSPRTRLALLDHVVSQTGLVFPIAELVQALTAVGIDTLIDGAHAPGMVPLDLIQIGATYYTGNCHKWLCAPKGAAFLAVRADRQSQIHPLTISHGANSPRQDRSRFRLEFDWTGTADPTPYLCVPRAIEFLATLLPGGWPALMAHNQAQALAARNLLCDQFNVAPPSPDGMVGALATIPLPAGDAIALQDALLEKFNIEVPIIPFPHPPHRLLRISAQIYNTPEHYDYLAKSLVTLLNQREKVRDCE
jgi:isopenicillin-N epimerase